MIEASVKKCSVMCNVQCLCRESRVEIAKNIKKRLEPVGNIDTWKASMK